MTKVPASPSRLVARQLPGDKAEISYQNVSRAFETPGGSEFLAVSGVSLDVRTGEFVSVIGPSGCGKSTLLNMAAGLFHPTHGAVSYQGRRVTGLNNDVGYVTQKDTLLPWRTVERNVALALEVQGMPKRRREARVREVLEQVGLSGGARKYPAQLSGGMLKRAALAQTLAYEPNTLLMDEPFGALDAQLRNSLQSLLMRIWAESEMTVVFVTHDLEEAILLSDRVVVFGASPGSIIHVENIDLPRPRSFLELRSHPTFVETWQRLWRLLEPQLSSTAERNS